tara:strand:- start:222 stop:503 length:282 start_codon:yes stop_codon:yes gene_type:complete
LIFETAGIVGVDPGPFTLAELLIMAEGRQRDMWHHTAQITAIMANIHRGPKTKPFEIHDFHPFIDSPRARGRGGIPIKADNITLLRAAFCNPN